MPGNAELAQLGNGFDNVAPQQFRDHEPLDQYEPALQY